MKTISHSVYGAFVFSLTLCLSATLQAQPLARGGGAVSSGSIVQCGAGTFDLTQLNIIDPGSVPTVGSFYLASGGPPYPGPPALFNPGLYGSDGTAVPVYVINAQHHQYLADDRAVLALKLLAQSLDDPIPIPGGGGYTNGGGGSGTNGGGWSGPVWGPGDFYLEAVSVTNGLFSIILHNTTNGSTYLALSTEALDLATTNTWLVEGSFQGGTNDATPFALGVGARTNNQLFIRAEACDECAASVLPLDWQLEYFGVTGLDPNSDPAGSGHTLLDSWLSSLDPNPIRFTISAAPYVNTTAVPLQLNIASGLPYYYAVILDTNTASASWLPFTSTTLSVPTPTDGVYTVSVGLRGLPVSATQTWQSVTLTRDTTPLVLALTNLPTLSGSRPFIDPAGYASRALSAITWTVLDANGGTNSGSGTVVAQGWNLLDPYHVTNCFHCLDLALAPGTNWISIQATDWAGTVAVTNFPYVFDTNGDTTAPALALVWPQDGTQVSGSSLTVQAWTDDDTAAVALQYTDTNAIVQTVNALVERGGSVWVENVPLLAGTNSFTLLATDAAGNVNTTNFSVVQSSVTFTVYPVPGDQLKYGYVTVYGTVADTGSTITVNGVQGTNNGDGTWQADNVPLPPGGTVTLQATAQLADGTTLQTHLEQERGPVVFAQTYADKLDCNLEQWAGDELTVSVTHHVDMQWARGVGGTNLEIFTSLDCDTGDLYSNLTVTVWPADNGYWPVLPGQQVINSYSNGVFTSSSVSTAQVPPVEWMEESATAGPWPTSGGGGYSESSAREVRLFTGGKATRQEQGLFDLSAALTVESVLEPGAQEWAFVYQGLSSFLQPADPPVSVPSQQIGLGALGTLGNDGNLWTVQPDGIEIGLTPKAFAATSSPFLASSPPGTSETGQLPPEQKYTLRINLNFSDITDKTTNVYVGEEVTLSCYLDPLGPPITNCQWTVPGTYVGGYLTASVSGTNLPVTLTNDVVTYYWVDKLTAGDVTCTATAVGKQWSAKTTFNVLKPTADWTGSSCGVFSFEPGGMYFEDLTNGVNGMTFTFTNMNLQGYTGTQAFKSAQIGSTQVTFEGTNASGAAKTVRFTAQGLDKEFPYKSFGSAAGGKVGDSPGTPVGPSETNAPLVYVNSVTYSGQFDHYLFFLPAGAGSIPVAVKRIGWQFSMQATNSGATSAPDTLVSSNCTANVTANNVPVTGNPQWTNNLLNQIKTVTP